MPTSRSTDTCIIITSERMKGKLNANSEPDQPKFIRNEPGKEKEVKLKKGKESHNIELKDESEHSC